MNPKPSKKRLVFISCIVLLTIVIFNSQSPYLDSQDSKYIQLFLKDWHISQTPEQVHQNLESEINFISTVQDSVISQIKHSRISHKEFGNVSGYYINKKGECYDRAVLMEKIFSFYHFSFRHVFVYFGSGKKTPGIFTLFKKNLVSHALVEVKTSKGWMTLDTNSDWLGIDNNGNLLTTGELREKLASNKLDLRKKNSATNQPFWVGENNFSFVYGIYSRHGGLFSNKNQHLSASTMPSSMFHILPDYNLKMLFYNFFN